MSALGATATAAMLAADNVLPYALVPWMPPLRGHHRTSPGMQRAVDALLDAGGGLLAAHLRSGAVVIPAGFEPASPG